MIDRGLTELQNDVFEESETRRKAYDHFIKMVQKKKVCHDRAAAGFKTGRTHVYREGGSMKQDWYGPPEWLEEDMPARENPKTVYSSIQHLVLNRTEDVCHEKITSLLERFM